MGCRATEVREVHKGDEGSPVWPPRSEACRSLISTWPGSEQVLLHTHASEHVPGSRPDLSCPGSCSGEGHPAWKALGGKESIPSQEDGQKLGPWRSWSVHSPREPSVAPIHLERGHGQALKSGHDEGVGGQRLVGTGPSADDPVPPRCQEAWPSRGDLPERAGVLKSHRELDSRIAGCTVQ